MPIFYIVGGPGLLIKEQLQLGYNNIDILKLHSNVGYAKLQARCSMIEFYQSTDLPMAPLYVVFKDLDLAKLPSSPPSVPHLVVVELKSQIREAHGLWSLKPKTRGT